jgi:O-methyltransferase involved in polyketide biosynthesis
MFDVLVADFLRDHPEGTVVEIGCGLNTRFERLDNGRVHWFDLDLPDSIELRQRFFSDSDRRTTLAAWFSIRTGSRQCGAAPGHTSSSRKLYSSTWRNGR